MQGQAAWSSLDLCLSLLETFDHSDNTGVPMTTISFFFLVK